MPFFDATISKKIKQETSAVEKAVLLMLNILFVWILLNTSGYFPLDNPQQMLAAKEAINNHRWFFPSSGQWHITHYLVNTFLGVLTNNDVRSYYIGQFLSVSLGFTMIFKLMSRYQVNSIVKWLIMVMFYLQTPYCENIFTIGKSEPYLVATSLYILYIWYSFSLEKNISTVKSVGYILILASISFFYCVSKETGVSIIVFIITIFVLGRITKQSRQFMLRSSICSGTYILVFLITRLVKSSFPQGNDLYITYNVSFNLIIQNLKMYLKVTPDMFIIGVLSFALCCYLFIKANRSSAFVFSSALSLWGWAYICGMLLWRWPFIYYMIFPYTLFLVSIAFASMELHLEIIFTKKNAIGGLCKIALATLILHAWQYNYFAATSHIDVGKTYTNSIEDVLALAEPGKTLFLENYDFYEEPVQKTQMLLNRILELDLHVNGLGPIYFDGKFSAETLKLYGYGIENMDEIIRDPEVHDYILIYDNYREFPAQIRLINQYSPQRNHSRLEDKGYELKLLSADRNDRDYFNIDYRIIGKTHADSGYKLFEVVKGKALNSLEGLYDGGWTGDSVTFNGLTRDAKITINPVSFSAYSTNNLVIFENGVPVSKISIDENTDSFLLSQYIPTIGNGSAITVKIENTFIPAEFLDNSTDDRVLGININVEYLENN